MKKSPNAGLSGAVRVQQLKLSDLTMAEKHGKRMDATSRARRTSRDAPLSTTGLNLQKLHRYHLKDTFVPKAKSKAMHVIIQFPKDLVDGEKPALMLRHARAFVEDVFGPDAIFADRVDRDEKGRHIVDIFIAPKYMKITKHQQKIAVTMSRHLKALAVKHDRPTTPRGTGHALQDALFAYFRDVMKLPGVQRGSPKTIAGPDWLSAEQLREQELQEQRSELQRERSELERSARSVAEQEKQAASASEETEEKRRAAREDRDLAKAELEKAKRDADTRRREADAERERQAEADRMARTEMELQQAELLVSAANANSEAVAERDRAKKLAEQLESEKREISNAKAEIAATVAAGNLEREEGRQSREEAKQIKREALQERENAAARILLDQNQLALLERASDDEQGLNLRANGQAFTMNESEMTSEERKAYTSPWSKILHNMALKLAAILDRVREMTRQVRAREEVAEKRIAEAQQREHDAEKQALDSLASARKALADETSAMKLEKASHRAKTEALRGRESAIAAIADTAQLWSQVTQQLVSSPHRFDVSSSGALALTNAGRKEAPALEAILMKEPPDWVRTIAKQQRELSIATARAATRDVEAKQNAIRLKELIAKAGPVLSPKQEAFKVEANTALRQLGIPPTGIER
ncbi:hypothetical protein [Erythrobacter sp. MTPC3]|uniref:hypothetical protein n=1 Tax=Erythrobacter sp. MTPC3 TaxID=3056564 RepID=UPI0036F26555